MCARAYISRHPYPTIYYLSAREFHAVLTLQLHWICTGLTGYSLTNFITGDLVIIVFNQEWRRWCRLIQQFSYCFSLIHDFARTRSSLPPLNRVKI